MNYYMIAGEASGDLHAANLMRELRRRDPEATFRCWGGERMETEGGFIVKHYRELAFMGFVEVLKHLPAVLGNIRECKKDLREHRPDVLILVDFPGFNLRIAEFARQQGITVFYYISPKIWAWNQKRVLKIKRVVDKMFCILPFEVDFYRKWGMEVDYIGNPLVDAIAEWKRTQRNDSATGNSDAANADRANPDGANPEKQERTNKVASGKDELPVIALLPGSRKQEITRILPEMLQATDRFNGVTVVIAGAPTFSSDFYRPFIGNRPVSIVFGHTYDLLDRATAALVTSGTATLETALFHVPQVVLYKANALSVAIARRVIKVRYISLVNLIADREIVRELIQEACHADKIAGELERLLYDETYRAGMLANYQALQTIVGEPGASARAAEKMIQYLS